MQDDAVSSTALYDHGWQRVSMHLAQPLDHATTLGQERDIPLAQEKISWRYRPWVSGFTLTPLQTMISANWPNVVILTHWGAHEHILRGLQRGDGDDVVSAGASAMFAPACGRRSGGPREKTSAGRGSDPHERTRQSAQQEQERTSPSEPPTFLAVAPRFVVRALNLALSYDARLGVRIEGHVRAQARSRRSSY
jgi:hypothetical protein